MFTKRSFMRNWGSSLPMWMALTPHLLPESTEAADTQHSYRNRPQTTCRETKGNLRHEGETLSRKLGLEKKAFSIQGKLSPGWPPAVVERGSCCFLWCDLGWAPLPPEPGCQKWWWHLSQGEGETRKSGRCCRHCMNVVSFPSLSQHPQQLRDCQKGQGWV